MFPCPVNIVVRFGVHLMFIFSLSLITGKYSFVTAPLVVWSYCRCHVFILISVSSLNTTLFGTFL